MKEHCFQQIRYKALKNSCFKDEVVLGKLAVKTQSPIWQRRDISFTSDLSPFKIEYKKKMKRSSQIKTKVKEGYLRNLE